MSIESNLIRTAAYKIAVSEKWIGTTVRRGLSKLSPQAQTARKSQFINKMHGIAAKTHAKGLQVPGKQRIRTNLYEKAHRAAGQVSKMSPTSSLPAYRT